LDNFQIIRDVAIDHYHRCKEDVQVMKDMGAHACRFPISRPRLFPHGIGQLNQTYSTSTIGWWTS